MNWALKLLNERSLYYDARSKKHQITLNIVGFLAPVLALCRL